MSTKQIMVGLLSLTLVAVLTFGVVWIVGNFNTVKSGMGGVNLYTKEDLDNAYQDGYNTAITNKAEYEALIDNYRDTITILNDTVSKLNSQILDLQSQIATLITSNTNKDVTISSLNAQIGTLQASISSLTAQVSSLTTSISNLTSDNAELNLIIATLNSTIANLQLQSTTFTVTIAQLNSLISYLSGIIIDWENRTEFVVTYYVNGLAWDIQVISNPAMKPTLPTSPSGNWSFVGWSLDGVTVIDPTQINVISDIKFYAVINCTVTFKVDGNNYDVQIKPYGGYASLPVEPMKPVYAFSGWSLDEVNVVTSLFVHQNTTYYAMFTFLPVSFAVDSPELIKAVAMAGLAPTIYNIGDEKDITLTTSEVITVQILGFNHDDKADGSGKAPITLGMKELLADTYRMNPTSSNVGGWNATELRNTTLAMIFSQFPQEWKDIIEEVIKKATAGNLSTEIQASVDKLFLFSEVEISGTAALGYADEGSQYEYWRTVKDGTVIADRAKYYSNGEGPRGAWWLRSPSLVVVSSFRGVPSNSNDFANAGCSYLYAVCFGFCI